MERKGLLINLHEMKKLATGTDSTILWTVRRYLWGNNLYGSWCQLCFLFTIFIFAHAPKEKLEG